jgi:CubicO group peptidase (beta-lactamase class C family)
MKVISPEKVGFSSERLERITHGMQRYIDKGLIAGIVTLVARRGEVAHFKKFGLQDIETNKPVELDTIFRIYSMTKPITSVALMMLYEQGLFQLNDPVTKFLPEFKKVKVWEKKDKLVDPEREITIHDLLTHTAGLSYGDDETSPVDALYMEADIWASDISCEEMVRRIAKLPLRHHPGRLWCYSVATDVVGHLVERISDMSLAEYFEEKVLHPLDMMDTAFSVPHEKVDRFATLYGLTDEGPLELLDASEYGDYFDNKLFAGGQGLVSTAKDYLRFAQLLLNKGVLGDVRLLGRKTIELMTVNHLPQALLPLKMGDELMPGLGFGLGFSVIVDITHSYIMGTLGSYQWGGWANTHFWIDPREDLIGILMLQYIPGGTYPITNDFRALVYQAIID